jgi:hypothetical protein
MNSPSSRVCLFSEGGSSCEGPSEGVKLAILNTLTIRQPGYSTKHASICPSDSAPCYRPGDNQMGPSYGWMARVIGVAVDNVGRGKICLPLLSYLYPSFVLYGNCTPFFLISRLVLEKLLRYAEELRDLGACWFIRRLQRKEAKILNGLADSKLLWRRLREVDNRDSVHVGK